MSNINISIKEEIVRLFVKYKQLGTKYIYSTISNDIFRSYGIKLDSEEIRAVCRSYRRKHNLDENLKSITVKKVDSEIISFDINKDGTKSSSKVISIKNMQNITPDELLEIHGFDPSDFELVSSRNSNSLTSQNKETYRSSVVVKPRDTFAWNQKQITKIINGIKINPIRTIYAKNSNNSDKCLILPICDLHFGMRADFGTTGEVYNLDIAEQQYIDVVNDILYRVRDIDLRTIYFTIGSDMLNCDNKQGNTTKGTPQSNDGDIEEFIIRMTDLIVNTVEKLRVKANVEIIHIPANHDNITSFGIANLLRVLYRECHDVHVDYSAINRKYHKFGNTLIGFSHKTTHKNINDIIQAEARELLGVTTNTVFLSQHYHHEISLDKYGTDYRVLPTMSPNSRWAHEQGYSSRKKVQSFVLDSEDGVTDVLYSFVR